jgi:7,8-dihydropterin-6-yl-methyl-4-(beta-D-ribofuranosyl)aminobenzene 5'-phosphate synthase
METIALEPVDSLTITVLIDNVNDIFLPEMGPVKRFDPSRSEVIETPILDGELRRKLVAEHGFSALVTMVRAGRTRHS